MAMALTEENVAKLPSDGSSFSSYYPSSRGTRTPAASRILNSPVVALPAVLSPVARLEQAKKSAYFYMVRLSRLGVEGRHILRHDELYIAGQDDVRFRRSGSHTKDADNLEYWEAKVQFFREKYEPLYNAMYPPIIIDPESPSMIRQAEIDRVYFRWARRTRYIEAWLSATIQERKSTTLIFFYLLLTGAYSY